MSLHHWWNSWTDAILFLELLYSVLHRESSVNSACVAIFHSYHSRRISMDISFYRLQHEENLNNLSSFYVIYQYKYLP